MDNFGKNPPRALESFGVTGLLDENCQVFYDSLFSTKHVGRVSDLIAARLAESGPDELKLRAVLLYTLFEAYRAQLPPASAESGVVDNRILPEPMVLECGIDDEKVALGISFTLAEGADLQSDGLVDRIVQRQAQAGVEALLSELHVHADKLVIRHQPTIRRIEIVTLLGIPGKIDAQALAPGKPPELVELGAKAAEAPKASAYVELGDLDYNRLLTENRPGASNPSPLSGDILVGAASAGPTGSDVVKISGTTSQASDNTAIRISGVTDKLGTDNTAIKVSGGAGPAGPSEMTSAKEELYKSQIAELQKKITELQEKAAGHATVVQGGEEGDDEEEETVVSSASENVKGLLKKVWPFSRGKADEAKEDEEDDEEDEEDEEETDEESEASDKKEKSAEKAAEEEDDDDEEDEDDDEDEEEEEEEAPKKKAEPEKPAVAEKPAAKEEGAEGPSVAETAANSLMAEITSGSLDRTLSRAQKEMGDIKKDLGNGRAKKFVDGLMEGLVAEKAKLAEMTKKLNQSIRTKELEFRSREQGLKEELRRRDDMLRQKNAALTRTKDQLAQAQIQAERAKQQGHAAADDAHFKAKWQQNEKILGAVREENKNLNEKIEELRNKLNTAQFVAAKNKGGASSSTEVTEMKMKMDRVQKQADEVKRQNSQLMEKLNEANSKKDRAQAGNVDDLKKRLEASIKATAVKQKESEQLQLRNDELGREIELLKKELAKAKVPKAA